MNIAIIVTGRFSIPNDMFFRVNFYEKVKNHDLFISTYDDDKTKEYINKLKNIKYLNLESSKKLKKTFFNFNNNNYLLSGPNNKSTNLYQWYHLNKIIKDMKKYLLNYDIVLKLRPDMYFNSIVEIDYNKIDDNTIYSFTDCLFYGKSEHFIKTFENYFEDIFTKYINTSKKYIFINYKNLIKSDFNEINNFFRLQLPLVLYEYKKKKRKTKFKEINNILKIKKNIIKNINLLKNQNFERADIASLGKNSYFSSEKCFLYNVINHGILKYVQFLCYRPRKF
jgi:hypothetical protein